MKAIVSQKGQVTIPKPCRERLGLRPGTVLEFRALDGKLIAVKKQAEDAIHKWRGKARLPGGLSVDQYIDKSRR